MFGTKANGEKNIVDSNRAKKEIKFRKHLAEKQLIMAPDTNSSDIQ